MRRTKITWRKCKYTLDTGKPLTHLLHEIRREDSGGKGSAEDVRKLFVKASYTHLFKVPVWGDDGLVRFSGLGFT